MSTAPINATTSMQALFQFAGLQPSLFAANSRYLGLATSTLVTPDGTSIAYVQRRFIPQPTQLVQLQQHAVVQGDRLDILAAQYLGDPQLFWRICDANGAMRPQDLTATVGRILRICLPAGIPGGPSAA
jgi:hypothetical protein